MITAIRRSFRSKIYKIILWITFLAVGGVFSIFEVFKAFFKSSSGREWVFTVNGKKIYESDFLRATASQEERIQIMRSQYGQYADLYFQMMGLSLNPQLLAARELIQKELLNEVAAHLYLRVSSDIAQSQLQNPIALTQHLADLISFSLWDPSINGINPLALNLYLQQIGMSTGQFEKELRNAVLRSDVKELVEHSFYIPLFEVKSQFIQNNLGHKFSIATISGQEIINEVKKEPVTDEALTEYYKLKNEQEQKYRVPEKRVARVTSFEPSTYGITITESDVETYYANNKAQFIDQPVQVQVRRILLTVDDAAQEKEIKKEAENLVVRAKNNPEQFATLAKEYSKDTKTAADGGLMPYFSKGKHDKTFERTAFTLKDDGAISDVIRTADGYEILQRVGKKLQTFKPLSMVSKEIKDVLLKKKFTEQFTTDARKAISKGDAEALTQFSKEKKGKSDGDITMAENKQSTLSRIMFRLKKGESSFFIDNNIGKLVTLTAIQPTHIPEPMSIKELVKEDYYKEKASAQLTQELTAFQEGKRAFDSLKKVEKTGWITAEDQKEIATLAQKGIDARKLFQLENKGSRVIGQHNGNGYVVRLDEIAPFDQSQFEQKKQSIKERLTEQRKSLIFGAFVASLYRNAKINTNKSHFPLEL